MTSAQIPEPSGWKSVRSTYVDAVRAKFMSKDDLGKQVAAINYFMDRLQQDKDALFDKKPLPDY